MKERLAGMEWMLARYSGGTAAAGSSFTVSQAEQLLMTALLARMMLPSRSLTPDARPPSYSIS